MDSTFLFVLAVLAGCVWLLVQVRKDKSVERQEEVTIAQNLSEPRRKPKAYLADLLPLSPPVVLSEDAGEPDPSVPLENILVSREYPLIPFRKHGPWVPPGETITVTVRTNSDGEPTTIFAH